MMKIHIPSKNITSVPILVILLLLSIVFRTTETTMISNKQNQYLCEALQNIQFPSFPSFLTLPNNNNNKRSLLRSLEDELLTAIDSNKDRLSNNEMINDIIQQLESNSIYSIQEPAIASEIYGTWRLLYTTAPNTASPIQRRAVNAQQFPIYQDIIVDTTTTNQQQQQQQLIVKQVVKFSDTITLSVDAIASTSAYPNKELQTPRQTTGKILGLNILGVSKVGDEALPMTKPNTRIDFIFDQGTFYIGNTIQIPYPVPFRLPILRDTVKGWIDITYLSERIRISRGNKGTTFVLRKE